MGTRPSFAWRSMHGRELLKQGLCRRIGNGDTSNVWAENWIVDTIPRPPMYKEDSEVQLALKVSELINVTGRWNREMLFETFAAEDAERIMQIKPMLNEPDSYQWGFTKTGTYTTRSGYQFSESLVDTQQGQGNALPPIGKKFWRSIWKIKAPPKLKHFLLRVLSGVLAVKDRLRSWGIFLDTTCQTCGLAD